MNWKIITAVLLLPLVVILAACTQTETTPNIPSNNSGTTNASPTVQAPPLAISQQPNTTSQELVKISDILSKPDSYQGQNVIVEGKIQSECGSGCWFTLNDGTGTIYIDLAPSNLVIPQKRGYKATVLAEVTQEKGDTYLIGKKVEF